MTPNYASIEHHLDDLSEVEMANSPVKKPFRWFVPFGILTTLLLLLFISSRAPNAEHPRSKYYQYVPFLWQTRVENYNFKIRPVEQQCYDGTIARYNHPMSSQSIPRVVHFTWGLKGDGAFTFPFYLAIRAALQSIQPDEIKVHYTNIDLDNPYFRALKPNITLVHHDPDHYLAASGFEKKIDIRSWHVAHVADILRLHILKKEGGIYLDSDAYVLHPFDTLLGGARDVIMGHEGGNRYGMANAVIVAKQNASFINRWMESYAKTFDPSDWNGHSVVLPKRLATLHPREVCVLSPTAFFWPLWTESHVEYMHKSLTAEEVREVEARINRYGGRLYNDQLVYHAWSQNSMDQYVRHLTPDKIRNEQTRFNILMRRFLD